MNGSSFDLELVTAAFSRQFVLVSILIIVVLVIVAMTVKRPSERVKSFLFLSIAAMIVATTLVLAGVTIYLNSVSWSKGPVHWHADFEVWGCGEELDLLDPQGTFSNKTGTPTRHEHNDKRLHFEGVVVNEEDASLTNFFKALGGELTSSTLVFPTNDGLARYQAGDRCPNGAPGEVHVFVYQPNDDGTFRQRLVQPEFHHLSPHAQVPPGDCLIVEFRPPRERTDHLCQSYLVAQEIGKLKGEVP